MLSPKLIGTIVYVTDTLNNGYYQNFNTCGCVYVVKLYCAL